MKKKRKKTAKLSAIYVAAVMAIGFCLAVFACVKTLSAPQAVGQMAELKIVIDAGHGGIDGGVVGVATGQKESDVNLRVAFLLKDRLADAGFAVTMTRATEAGLYGTTAPGFKLRDMQKRREICESASPLCVISIHQNFYPSSASRGAQVFYRKDSEQSELLAVSIQGELNGLYKKEGVKARKQTAAEYYMLKLTPPSVIVECGFLSNPKDDRLLANGVFCGKLADSIVSGVLSGLKTLSST